MRRTTRLDRAPSLARHPLAEGGGRARVARAAALAVAGIALAASSAAAQVSVLHAKPAAAVAPPAPSLSVSIASGAAQAIANLQDDAPNTFPTPIAVSVSWSDVQYPTNLCVVAYFADPTRALASGPTGIASSRIEGRVTSNGGTGAWTPFTQNGCSFGVGTTGGSLRLLSALLNGNGSSSGSAQVRINLVGQPSLPPGTYGGVLNIRAVIQ